MRIAKMTVPVVAILAASGCSRGARPPQPDEVPETVSVTGGAFTSGVSIGRLRSQSDVDGFRITKFPVTVGHYRQCINVGACTPPKVQTPACTQAFQTPAATVDRATFNAGDDDLPVTCISVQQANDYCQWQGGSLPTADQWLMAARGGDPKRHAWGNDTATCDRHPGGKQLSPSGRLIQCTSAIGDFKVGKHPNSASPFGVQDVLLSSGELTGGQQASHFGACNAGECIAQGIFAGAIDGFSTAAKDSSTVDPKQTTYSFRCVLPEVSR